MATTAAFLLVLGFGPARPALAGELGSFSIERSGTNVEIQWSDIGAMLQSATNAAGPWSQVSNAVSPYLVASSEVATFYRLEGSQEEARYGPPTFDIAIGNPLSSCDCTSPENPNSIEAPGNAQDNALGSVFLHTGELVQHAMDLSIPGVGLDWAFERFYRSGMKHDGPLGQGWEFNYDRRLAVQSDGSVLRLDGWRANLYALLTNGIWQSPSGFYTRLTRNSDGSFVERDRHGTQTFYQAADSFSIARLSKITDRYGNSLTFDYNPAGQLRQVVDTLNRTNAYNYDAAGRLTNVVDYAGRTLTFGYDAGDDLISATGPAVIGTTNGNDFPGGKTTFYTYDASHKLLTVTAPNEAASAGPPRLGADYDPTSGRLVSLRLGGTNATGIAAGGTLTYGYTDLAQAMPGDVTTAVFQTLATNRNGNVTRYQFNQLGNVLNMVQFTRGLRAGDPPGYTNTFAYNADGETISHSYPESNAKQFIFDASNPDRFQQGNLLQTVQMPGPRGGDQSQIVTRATYETNFNLISSSIDPRGGVTTYERDAQGNCTNKVHRIPSIVEEAAYDSTGRMIARVTPDNGSGYRRRDTMSYYTNGPQNGYLRQVIVDAGALNLTTTYEYDSVGNVIRTIDANGNDRLYSVNALNQIVLEATPAVSTPHGLTRYLRFFYFDANDSLVLDRVQNVDQTGVAVSANPYFTNTYSYDILKCVLNTTHQVAGSHTVTTSFAYDANENRTLTRSPVATSGLQPNTVVQTLYDERDLEYQQIRGPNDSGHSTTQYDYDGNKNCTNVIQGVEDLVTPRITSYSYDGYERQTSVRDAMGNVSTTHYDGNGNPVINRIDGELVDLPGSAFNVRLSQTASSYDAMDRLTNSDVAFFDTPSQSNIGSGHAFTQTFYSDNSQVIMTIDANNNISITSYDNISRPSVMTDAKSNTVAYSYDKNGNILAITETDKSDLGNPDQSFTTTNAYDALDRNISVSDNLNNTAQYLYDSRNNVALEIDEAGNQTLYGYDGLGRMVETSYDMNTNGMFTDSGDITIGQSFDDNSRLSGSTDGNGHTTQYVYDALERCIATQLADGTLRQTGTGISWPLGLAQPNLSGFVSGYDVHDNPTVTVDANGTEVDSTFDLLDRVVSNRVLRAAGVLGTTNEVFQYDGRSRVVTAQNDAATVSRTFDSLSHVTRETEQYSVTETVTAAYDALDNQTNLMYPGGRDIVRTFNSLNCPILVDDAHSGPVSPLAKYFYVGEDRPEERDYGNQTASYFGYDGITGIANEPGDFGVGRLSSLSHYSFPLSKTVGGQGYTYGRTGEETQYLDYGLPDNRSYAYDAAGRLIASDFITAKETNIYNLDSAGNRLSVISNGVAGLYSLDCTLPAPADCEVNQYTTTPFDARAYDRNGDLTNIVFTNGVQRALSYDFRGELIQVADHPSSNAFVAQYAYDAFGRRIAATNQAGATLFYYDGFEEIEDRDATGEVLATYVYSKGEASEIQMQLSGTNSTPTGTNYFFHEDLLHSLAAATDASGAVVQQNKYDPYGKNIAPPSDLPITIPIGFAGMRVDSETGFLWGDSGNLDPAAGRYLQPYAADFLGNAVTYAANSPTMLFAARKSPGQAQQHQQQHVIKKGKPPTKPPGKPPIKKPPKPPKPPPKNPKGNAIGKKPGEQPKPNPEPKPEPQPTTPPPEETPQEPPKPVETPPPQKPAGPEKQVKPAAPPTDGPAPKKDTPAAENPPPPPPPDPYPLGQHNVTSCTPYRLKLEEGQYCIHLLTKETKAGSLVVDVDGEIHTLDFPTPLYGEWKGKKFIFHLNGQKGAFGGIIEIQKGPCPNGAWTGD